MAPRKGGLYKRLAKTTGTTTGEAQGTVKSARSMIAKGNRAGAAKKIEKALSGGPAAGVKANPKRAKKAKKAARKITRRIQSRQRTKKTSTRDARKKTSLGPPSATDGGPGTGTDPSWMGQYSEEQISMMGGRERMLTVLAAKERHFAETGVGDPWAGTGGLSAPGTEEATPTAPTRGKKPKRTAGRTKRGVKGRARRSR